MTTNDDTLMTLKTWIDERAERFGQSAFRFTTPAGMVLYIDHFRLPADPRPADLLLVTHPHGDHFNPRVIRALSKPGTRVVTPASMKAEGLDRGLATDTLAPGQSAVVAGITVTAVAAYNLRLPLHPRAQAWVGYVFDLDGVTLYHAGDTDLTPELGAVRTDVALLPVGGLVTMGPRQARAAAEALGPQIVIPMHYGFIPFTGGAGQAFARRWSGLTMLLEG